MKPFSYFYFDRTTEQWPFFFRIFNNFNIADEENRLSLELSRETTWIYDFYRILSRVVIIFRVNPLDLNFIWEKEIRRAKNYRAPIAMSCLNVLNVTSMATERWTPNSLYSRWCLSMYIFFSVFGLNIFAPRRRRRQCVRLCWLYFPFCSSARIFLLFHPSACGMCNQIRIARRGCNTSIGTTQTCRKCLCVCVCAVREAKHSREFESTLYGWQTHTRKRWEMNELNAEKACAKMNIPCTMNLCTMDVTLLRVTWLVYVPRPHACNIGIFIRRKCCAESTRDWRIVDTNAVSCAAAPEFIPVSRRVVC